MLLVLLLFECKPLANASCLVGCLWAVFTRGAILIARSFTPNALESSAARCCQSLLETRQHLGHFGWLLITAIHSFINTRQSLLVFSFKKSSSNSGGIQRPPFLAQGCRKSLVHRPRLNIRSLCPDQFLAHFLGCELKCYAVNSC